MATATFDPQLSSKRIRDERRHVPIGVAGELFIGGNGVVRGYLNKPELTAERFIKNPFGDRPGTRLYRTGDLARYRPDGNIEFLGRLDHQVKIRGHRIELGEIETVLDQHLAVRQAVVVAREDVPGDQRLVAYLVPDHHQKLSASTLRDYLENKLPEFMVPSNLIILDVLPLTPNGKIDRRALTAPDQTRPDMVEGTFVAPRTPVEKKLAKIWAKVLRVKRVGVHNNFFKLGGHSLLAMQVPLRIRRTFDVDLPLQTFLKVPTIAGLAEKLEEQMQGQTQKTGPNSEIIVSPEKARRMLGL